MTKKHPTCKQVVDALLRLGFTQKKKLKKGGGTSHTHYVKYDGKGDLVGKVTVDCPKAPFNDFLVRSMAKQSGLSKKDFLYHCFNKVKKKS